jgi:hypothetical protein
MYVCNVPHYQIPNAYLQGFIGFRQQTEISRKFSHVVNLRCTNQEIRQEKLHIVLRLTILHSILQHYESLL